MFATTSDQIVPLDPFRLEVGHRYTLTISGASGNFTLQFLHGDDTVTWHDDPEVTGTPGGGVDKEAFRCVSSRYRLNFAVAPAGPMRISCVPDAAPTF